MVYVTYKSSYKNRLKSKSGVVLACAERAPAEGDEGVADGPWGPISGP